MDRIKYVGFDMDHTLVGKTFTVVNLLRILLTGISRCTLSCSLQVSSLRTAGV